MTDNVVVYSKEGSTGFISVNRPEVKNALNMKVFRALDKVLDEVAADEEVRVLVVTGAGSSFVAGADINELLALGVQSGWMASRYQHSVFNKLERLRRPSIAAITGFALGGGLELALSCTFRVASSKAKFAFPEIGLGIVPALGGTERLVRTVGYAKASELLLFRSIINGEEAYRIGLVNHVVEPDRVMEKAIECAHDLASLSPVAVSLEMELLINAAGRGFDAALALESALAPLAVASEEAKELLGAFLTKGRR